MKDYKNWKHMPCSWIGGLNISKVEVELCIQRNHTFYKEIDKLILKYKIKGLIFIDFKWKKEQNRGDWNRLTFIRSTDFLQRYQANSMGKR